VDWPTVLVSIVGNVAVAGVAIWALLAQTKNAERDRQHDLTSTGPIGSALRWLDV